MMNDESRAKRQQKPTGLQIFSIVLTLVGLVFTLAVAPVIGLPVLLTGIVLNMIALANKAKAVKTENAEN